MIYKFKEFKDEPLLAKKLLSQAGFSLELEILGLALWASSIFRDTAERIGTENLQK